MTQKPEMPPFLPTTREDMEARGWDELDIIFVTGDAYVDHPSFAPALLGRMLEAAGFRVGIIARPRPTEAEDFSRLGRPRLFFAVSAGSVDSMLNNYTAQKKRRRDDAYAPEGKGGNRPNRATIVYCNMLRREFGKKAAILAGGIEASLRRFAHYDFMDDSVRRPILLDAPADAIVYGMGEKPLQVFARAMKARMARGIEDIVPSEVLAQIAQSVPGAVYRTAASTRAPAGYHVLPTFEKVRDSAKRHVRAFQDELRFRNAGVYQDCGGYRVVANPPAEPLTSAEMDRVYAQQFRREAHPSNEGRVPALEQVRFSVTSHRGCFGGCSFCGILTHQGKTVQSRTRKSVLDEVKAIARHPEFDGTIRDIGGPSANMWRLECEHPENCQRTSCLAPFICKHLKTDQRPYMNLLNAASNVEGVKHVFVTTGVRMDLALQCEPFLDAFAQRYTSGHAKVAPEHVTDNVLSTMMKPRSTVFLKFLETFRRASSRAGKEQYVLPYFIAAHPGAKLEDAIEVALLLKREHLRVEQCQIFTPLPGTASAVMYATGINPYTDKPVHVERDTRRRQMHKALVLYHLPGNAKLIREALELCGREDLTKELIRGTPSARKRTRTTGGRVGGKR